MMRVVIVSSRHSFLPVIQMDPALFHIIGNRSKGPWTPFKQKVESRRELERVKERNQDAYYSINVCR